MPLFLITGAPGSGKSTILRELQRRGHSAYGTDEHNYSRWANRLTGEVTTPPENFNLHAWYEDNEWELNLSAIGRAHDEANTSGKDIFLIGVAAGIGDAWESFDKVIVLDVDAETLSKRIMERNDNNFGKAPKELRLILDWQDHHVDRYRQRGAIVVDGTPPTAVVVNDILAKIAI